MSKEQRAALDQMLREGPLDLAGSVAEQRAVFSQMMAEIPLPADVRTEAGTLGSVPVVTVSIASSTATAAGTLLYLHGGAYTIGSAAQSAGLAAELARRSGTRAVSVDYALAPEAPYPAALDDALAAYRALLETGTEARSVVLVGESAGGGLAMATAVAARNAGLPLPAGIYLASPWADLTMSGASAVTKADADPSVSVAGLALRARDYAPQEDLNDPLISPVFADLTGLPPLLVQAGGNEVLLDDATRLATSAAAAGVHTTLQVTPDVPHVFVAFPAILDEAERALQTAGAFIAEALQGSADATAAAANEEG